MKKMYSAFLLITLMAGFLVIKEAQGWSRVMQSQTIPERGASQPEAQVSEDGSEPGIQSTRRISIPYGIASPLPMSSDGKNIIVTGHGGCTQYEEVTVTVTITQTVSGASATGETQQTCSGELQNWTAVATAETSTPFEAAGARACGVATTRADGEVTDTYEWCRDVTLTFWRIHLPFLTG